MFTFCDHLPPRHVQVRTHPRCQISSFVPVRRGDNRRKLACTTVVLRRGSGLQEFDSRRTEDIQQPRSARPRPEGMRYASRRAPKVTRLDRDLFPVLGPHAIAFEQNAPLFFGMTMRLTLRIGRDGDHGQHDAVAREYPALQTSGEHTVQTLGLVAEIVEVSPARAHLRLLSHTRAHPNSARSMNSAMRCHMAGGLAYIGKWPQCGISANSIP